MSDALSLKHLVVRLAIACSPVALIAALENVTPLVNVKSDVIETAQSPENIVATTVSKSAMPHRRAPQTWRARY